jgi:hypothetical protein
LINHDENVGFYLVVYPLDSNKSIADYLCDSLDEAFLEAESRYKIKRTEFR